jgi:hypothetical protein
MTDLDLSLPRAFDFHRFPQATYVTSDLAVAHNSLHNRPSKGSKLGEGKNDAIRQ